MKKKQVHRRQSKTYVKRKVGKVLVVTSNKEEEATAEIVYQRVAKYQKPTFLITKINEKDEYNQSSKPKLVYDQRKKN